MKGLFGFVAGLALGAVAALLLAPETGEELRSQIQDAANRDMTRLQEAFQRDMEELNTRMAKMQTEMQSYVQEEGVEEVVDVSSDIE